MFNLSCQNVEKKANSSDFIIVCSKWDIKHQKSLAISTENLARVPAANRQFHTASINFVQEMNILNLRRVVVIFFFTIEDNELSVIIKVDTYKTIQETAEENKG